MLGEGGGIKRGQALRLSPFLSPSVWHGSLAVHPHRRRYFHDEDRDQNDPKAGERPDPLRGERSPHENRHQPSKGKWNSDRKRNEPIIAHAVILAADSLDPPRGLVARVWRERENRG